MPDATSIRIKDSEGEWVTVQDREASEANQRRLALENFERDAGLAQNLNKEKAATAVDRARIRRRTQEENFERHLDVMQRFNKEKARTETDRALKARRTYEENYERHADVMQRLGKEKAETLVDRGLISRRARLEIDEAILRARQAGLMRRQVSVPLPAVNPNGSVSVGAWIPSEKSIVTKIEAGYLTVPGSTLGTIVLDVYKQDRQFADLTISGAANGDVTYTAWVVGAGGNAIRVAHVVGATGGGEEDRDLAVAVAGDDIIVTFGTDGAGASVVPSANEVAALINGDGDASALVSAAASGDGTGDTGTAALANLTGGLAAVLLQSSANYDLEGLTAGEPVTLTDGLLAKATRTVRAGEYVYVTITSDNGDAVDGTAGLLVITYTVSK